MGTRSIIMVVGDPARHSDKPEYKAGIRLYRHCDGYPEGNLPAIAGAIKRMEALVEQSGEWHTKQVRRYGVESMAYAIVAEGLGNAKPEILIEEVCKGAPNLKDLGNQGDLEWVYVVDCIERLVNVYSNKQPTSDLPDGKYCGVPVEHLGAGLFLSWEKHINGYREESRDEVRKAVENARQFVISTGWALCEEPDPYLRLLEKRNGKKAKPVAAVSVAMQKTDNSAWAW